jgi:eukaryotic-like serine/threonine-protein kinase
MEEAMSALDHIFRLQSGGLLGNRYRLDRCLGDGSYGIVWKAERLEDHQVVAVKIPKVQGGKNSDLEEGKSLMGRPVHPNVVQVHWMGRVPPGYELFVIEMEFFNSNTLAFLLDAREERMVSSYRTLLDRCTQILDGVCHLHELGITHGDIKPQNILVGGDVAKLTDFGSSLTTEDIYLRTRENGGTVLYSPPEYAGLNTRRREPALAVAHDVYSLGVLLYQLLTGRLPHDTLAQVAHYRPFPRPGELSASVVEELDAVVLRALSRQPEDRWASVDEMRTAFLLARDSQLASTSRRPPPRVPERRSDWSSQVLSLMDEQAWRDAEAAARAEYQRSRDPHALLLMVRSAVRDGRHFDAIRVLDGARDSLDSESPVAGDLEMLALNALVRTERVNEALEMAERCLQRQGDIPGILLRKASLLGMKARYQDAVEILVQLNRRLPRRRSILKRLVLVHRQLREFEQAEAFERVLAKVEREEAAPNSAPG